MKRFLAVLPLLLMSLVFAYSRNYYVVAVGVSDYPGEMNDLRLPSADAKSLAFLYKRSVNAMVTILTNEKATRQNITSKTRTHFSKAEIDDVVIFFFSGHGTQGGFSAYDGLLPYDDIRRLFGACRASNKIMFADACFSGDICQGGSTGQKEIGSDVMLFLSSRDNEYSIESPSMKNGFFTACLVRCLKGGADADRDRVITARELFSGVHKGVVELSNGKQHPVMWGNFNDDMPVINWKN